MKKISMTAVALNTETMKFDTITSNYHSTDDFISDLHGNGYYNILLILPTSELEKMANK
jgi:hypothetical protein